MTNELEKIFFDTFGVEPSTKYDYCWKSEENKDKLYPPITDRILLELIIILGSICTIFDKNVDDLKEHVLKNLIELSGRYHIYNQVRTLFEEGQCL